MRRAFTLIEVLIVVSILALLMIAVIMAVRNHRSRAEDARVKSDLETLKIAFEDYYNDNNCYPPGEWFDSALDCGANHLAPYLNKIPCDPKTNVPYSLYYSPSACGGFQLYGYLQNPSDPSYRSYYDSENLVGTYGVSSTNTTPNNPGELAAIPEDGGDGGSGGGEIDNNSYYWCSGVSNCTSYNPQLYSCTPSYTNDPNCGSPSESSRCLSSGSCTPL